MDSPSQNKLAVMRPSPSKGSKRGNALALQVLAALAEILPRANSREPFTPEALEFMADGLADLPSESLRIAANLARDRCKFFPSVAELRELAGMSEPSTQEREDAEASAAFDAACKWARRHAWRLYNAGSGHYAWPDDERLNEIPARAAQALSSSGGIDRVMGSRDPEAEKWFRRDFVAAWKIAPDVAEELARIEGNPALQIADALARKLSLRG